MSDPEPFAPRQFNPDEVIVPEAARASFSELRHLGGAVLWLSAAFTLGHSLISWQNSRPESWLEATGEVAGAVWMPVLGTVLLLQNLGEAISTGRRRCLSLATWGLFAWSVIMVALFSFSGLATSRIYQRQTEEHSSAEVLRSESFQKLRLVLQETSENSQMKKAVLAAGVSIPPSEPLPEAPRVLREHLINLIGQHEENLDKAALKQLHSDHGDTLVNGLAHVFAGIAATAIALLTWARSGWIRMLGD